MYEFIIHLTHECTVEPRLTEPQISGLLRLSGLDLCTFYLTPMVCTEQNRYTSSLEGRNRHTRMLIFEETEIGRLFASTMENMTGKEMAVLIMIHYRRYLHDDSHIWLFHLFGHGLVPL